MGGTPSCLRPGPSAGTLRTQIENGECQAVVAQVSQYPNLLTAPLYTGDNTILHVAARYGETTIVSALFDLVDELRRNEELQLQQRLAAESTTAALAAEGGTRKGGGTRAAACDEWRQQTAGKEDHAALTFVPGISTSELSPTAHCPQPTGQRMHSCSSSSSSSSSEALHERALGAHSAPAVRGISAVAAVPTPPASHAALSRSAALLASSLPQKASLANITNKHQQTPLHVAASRGNADIVMLLLQKGADVWRADRTERCTALHYAAMNGHVECVRTLLMWSTQQQQGHASVMQRPSITLSSRHPPPPRLGAARHPPPSASGSYRAPDPSSAEAAPRPGDTEARTTNTPARGSAPTPGQAGVTDSGHANPVSRLVNMVSASGATALHFAADAGHAEVTRLLCAHGADINAVMCPTRLCWLMLHYGATALHLAAEQGHLGVALAILRHYQENHLLLRGMMDPRDAQDRSGLRPHQLAFLTHNFRVALVIRPSYPLRWLFEPAPSADACYVPTLAMLAGAALRSHFRSEIDALQRQQQQQQVEQHHQQDVGSRSTQQRERRLLPPAPHLSLHPRRKTQPHFKKRRRAVSMVVTPITGVGAGAATSLAQRLQQLGTSSRNGATALTSGATTGGSSRPAVATPGNGSAAASTGPGAGAPQGAQPEGLVDEEAMFRARASSPVQDLLDVDTIRHAAGLEPLPQASSLRIPTSTRLQPSMGVVSSEHLQASAAQPGGGPSGVVSAVSSPWLTDQGQSGALGPGAPAGPGQHADQSPALLGSCLAGSSSARWAQQRSGTASPVPLLPLQAVALAMAASPLRLGGFATAALSLADAQQQQQQQQQWEQQRELPDKAHEPQVVQTARGVELEVGPGAPSTPSTIEHVAGQGGVTCTVPSSSPAHSLNSCSIGSSSSSLLYQADSGAVLPNRVPAKVGALEHLDPAAPSSSCVRRRLGAGGGGSSFLVQARLQTCVPCSGPAVLDGGSVMSEEAAGGEGAGAQDTESAEVQVLDDDLLDSDVGEEQRVGEIMEADQEEEEELEELATRSGAQDGVRAVALDDDVCDVCFEEGPRLKLQPCGHEVCLVCAQHLCAQIVSHPATCPFCRGNIIGVKG